MMTGCRRCALGAAALLLLGAAAIAIAARLPAAPIIVPGGAADTGLSDVHASGASGRTTGDGAIAIVVRGLEVVVTATPAVIRTDQACVLAATATGGMAPLLLHVEYGAVRREHHRQPDGQQILHSHSH